MKIHVKQTPNLTVPATATSQSSGYDVVALDYKIVGEIYKEATETTPALWKSIDYIEYKTGLFTAPQPDAYGHNYHTLIFPRSSVRKYNLVLANSIGLIDNDYRGELILCFKYIWQPSDFFLEKDSKVYGSVNVEKIYKRDDKVGQLVSEVTNHIDWIVVADLSATIRGAGGFGSTTDKRVEAPKAATNLIDKWRESGDVPIPQKYEEVAKEREKLIV